MVGHRSGARVSGSYYDLLGVPVTADQGAIRARYLLLMRRHHPDVNRSPTAHARAAELNEAFRSLVEPDLRARYDAALAAQRVLA
jgi:curved DNA-binding protein